MLAVLLLILKIIGILLLVILGLLLTLFLLVLFVPVRYRIRASYKEKARASVKITWLLHLLSVSAVYNDALDVGIKVLGFPLFSGDDGAEDKTAEVELVPEEQPGAEPGPEEQQEPKRLAGEAAKDGTQVTDRAEAPSDGGKSAADSAGHAERRKDANRETSSLLDKLETAKTKSAKIRDFITDSANQETFRLILRQIKALVRHILPRKVSADVVFGFDDPAVTGQVLSLCTFLYVWYGDSLRITPVFDEKVLEADVDAKGRIRFGTMAALGIRILLNKNFRILLKRFRMNGGL